VVIWVHGTKPEGRDLAKTKKNTKKILVFGAKGIFFFRLHSLASGAAHKWRLHVASPGGTLWRRAGLHFQVHFLSAEALFRIPGMFVFPPIFDNLFFFFFFFFFFCL